MAQAEASTKQFSAKSSASFQALSNDFAQLAGRLAAPLLGAVSIQGLAQITSELDAIGDAADNLEVSGRFLSALGQAARIAGSDAATAEAAMTRLLQTIGEARRGEATAVGIFERLGINIDDLQTNEDAVYAVARALGEFETNAERAAAASELFGRQGRKLAELFAEGETGLRNQIAEIERAGLAYSNAAISTGQATKGAGENIGRFFKVGIAELGAGLAQGAVFLKTFVDEATTFGTSISEAADKANRAVVELIDAQDRAARAQESRQPPRQAAEGGGGFGFAAPFLAEALKAAFPAIIEQGELAQFRAPFPGIPLNRPAAEELEAQQRRQNRITAEDQGFIRLQFETVEALRNSAQALDRVSGTLDKIESNTAVLKQ
jgi:hypothetical protein